MLTNINKIIKGNMNFYHIDNFKIKQIIMNYLFNYIEELKEINIDNIEQLKDIKDCKKYKVYKFKKGDNYILLLKQIKNIYYNVLIKNNFEYSEDKLNYNNLEILSLDINFPKNYYKGTIIEGRLIDNKIFEIYNIVKNINDINNIYNLKDNKFIFRKAALIDIKDIKKDKDVIGLLFLYNNNKYSIYFEYKIEKIISNLIIKKLNTDVFNVFCLDIDNKKFKLGIAHIPNIKTSHFFNKIITEINVKCWYEKKFNKWVPYEILSDDIIIDKFDNIQEKIIKI